MDIKEWERGTWDGRGRFGGRDTFSRMFFRALDWDWDWIWGDLNK